MNLDGILWRTRLSNWENDIAGFAGGILDCSGIRVSNLSQPTGADQPHQNNQQSAKDTALGADCTAREPGGARGTGI